MATSSIDVTYSGPMFDGQAIAAVNEWLNTTLHQVADLGVKELDAFVMDKTGRGTGRYQSEITTRDVSDTEILITDPVVYGPWLEGTSKRNESTRFKGYHLWRLTRLRLRRTFKNVAQQRLDEFYLARMGGR